MIHHNYLGSNPTRKSGLGQEIQGVTYDGEYWYVTKTNQDEAEHALWKYDKKFERVIATADIPQDNDFVVELYVTPENEPHPGPILYYYDHCGSPCYHDGFVFVPIFCQAIPSAVNRIMIFKAKDLAYIGNFSLVNIYQVPIASASWCATHPHTGDIYVQGGGTFWIFYIDYNSLKRGEIIVKHPDPNDPLAHWDTIDKLGLTSTFDCLQGATFSRDGKLFYVINGTFDFELTGDEFGKRGNTTPKDQVGIVAFDVPWERYVANTTKGGYVTDLSEESNLVVDCSHNYEDSGFSFVCDTDCYINGQEPESVTWWDLDDDSIPGMSGQLHAVLKEGGLPNQMWLQHYRVEQKDSYDLKFAFLERLAVARYNPTSPNPIPDGFPEFTDKYEIIKYYSHWDKLSIGSRRQYIAESKKAYTGQPIYIFLLFGPDRDIKINKINLNAVCDNGDTNSTAQIKLNEADDAKLGKYYWGKFIPPNPWNTSYDLKFEIDAEFLDIHSYDGRTYRKIDSDPSTVVYPKIVPFMGAVPHEYVGYEGGIDQNHMIKVKPLVPNSESKNDFTKAYSVDLKTTNPTLMEDLVISNESDPNYFLITYAGKPRDDESTADSITTSKGSFVSITHYPPRVQVAITEKTDSFVSSNTYRSTRAELPEYKQNCLNKIYYDICSPARFFNDKTLYLKVSNYKPELQGPVLYDIKLVYHGEQFVVRSDRVMVNWWIVRKHYDPDPPDDRYPEQFIVKDIPVFFKDYREFVDYAKENMGITDTTEKELKKADMLAEIGNWAKNFKVYDYAENYIKESADIYHKYRIKDREENSLESLIDVYDKQHRFEEITKIREIIHGLR
jgi:hypothetical protein